MPAVNAQIDTVAHAVRSKKDLHVAACVHALVAGKHDAGVTTVYLVTKNLRDFGVRKLAELGIEVSRPDEFLLALFGQDGPGVAGGSRRCAPPCDRTRQHLGHAVGQVDFDRRMAWMHPDQAKARRAIPVPLNGDAIAVLHKQLGRHRERVFTFCGQPVAATKTKAWHGAVKPAGVAPLRFHDLKHTFASLHVQQGTPLSVLQELGGRQSSAMVSRHAHLGAELLATWNDRLAAHGTNPSQGPDTVGEAAPRK